MKPSVTTITYTFADGTISAAEVNDELGAAIAELDARERRNNKRETRRHVSMDYLNENGIDFDDGKGDALSALIAQEDVQEFDDWLSSALNSKQIELLQMVWGGYSLTEIARYEGVQIPAISKRLKKILRKFEEIYENGKDLPFEVGIGRGTKSAYYVLRGLRK